MKSAGGACGPAEGLWRWDVPSHTWAAFPMGVYKEVSSAPLGEPWGSVLTASQLLSLADHFSHRGDRGQKWFLGLCPTWLEKAHPMGETAGFRGLVPSREGRWWKQSETFLFLSSTHPLPVWFPQWCAGTSPADSRRLQRNAYLGVWTKVNILWGVRGWRGRAPILSPCSHHLEGS